MHIKLLSSNNRTNVHTHTRKPQSSGIIYSITWFKNFNQNLKLALTIIFPRLEQELLLFLVCSFLYTMY